jgi:hypothetical protein
MSELRTIAELMSERDVYDRFPKVFADKELREARQNGEIEYYLLRMGPYYSEKQLIAYLEKRLRKPCQNRPLAPEPTEGCKRNSEALGTNDEALIARALEKTQGYKRKRKV